MSPRTIPDGDQISKDAQEVLIYVMDYDTAYLEAGIALENAGSFTVTPTGLTLDSEALSANFRQVRFRLSGGARGTVYKIEHTVDTLESPSQTLSKWFLLQITD